MAMPSISPEAFLYLMQACEQGVESSDSLIRAHACSSIYNICSYVVKETEKAERDANSSSAEQSSRRRSSVIPPNQISGNHWIMSYFRQFPQTLPTILSTVFNLVLFDDNSDQWSLSRPLYALMLLQREYAIKYTSAVIDRQLPERRSFVTTVSNFFFAVEVTTH